MIAAGTKVYFALKPADMRRYAESTVMRSCVEGWAAFVEERQGRTPHNHEVGREGLRAARSFSGARKRPRRSVGGRTASMAASFSVGSART